MGGDGRWGVSMVTSYPRGRGRDNNVSYEVIYDHITISITLCRPVGSDLHS